MSDELYDEEDDIEEEYEYEEDGEEASADADDDDYEVEEISSDDVDAVVEKLTAINDEVGSQNIRTVIENAVDEILRLVYTDDELLSDDEEEDEEDGYYEEAA